MLKRLSTLGAAVALAVGLSAQPAQAALVEYSANGTFGSTGTNRFHTGDYWIAFTGFSNILLPSSITEVGQFVISGAGNNRWTSLAGADDFTLTINQTLPTPGSGSFAAATMHGRIKWFQSSAYVLFDPDPLTIAGITYQITEADNGVPGRANLNPPQPGVASLTSTVSAFVTPEPGSLILLGLGFIGFASLARRRRARS